MRQLSGRGLTIDLKAATLSSRISYDGPAHFYWARSGLLALSAVNAWPLEYRDGFAVGRHEPEREATNVQGQSRATVIGDFVKESDDFTLMVSNGGPDGGPIANIPVGASSYAFSQDIDGPYLLPETRHQLTDNWKRTAFTLKSLKYSRLRLWLGRNKELSTPAFWLTQRAYLSAQQYAVSFFAKNGDGKTFPVGFGQIEAGTVSTSPIITGDGPETRPASSVTVDVRGYGEIEIAYSDGTSTTAKTAGDYFTIPTATRNWGERYMTTIKLLP